MAKNFNRAVRLRQKECDVPKTVVGAKPSEAQLSTIAFGASQTFCCSLTARSIISPA